MKLPGVAEKISQKLKLRHKLRHSTGLQFAFAERVDFLNPAAWDSLAGGHGLFMSRDYLRALETARMPELQHRYAMVFGDGVPLVILSMQLLELGLDRLRPLARDQDEGESAAARLRQRVLVCGNLLTYGLDGVAFAPGLDPQLGWHAVAEALYRIRRADKLQGGLQFVLVKDFDPARFAGSALLGELSYSAIETEPNMILELAPGWKSHDDYLAGMTSKYRSNVKSRILKPLADAGYTVAPLAADEVARHAARMQQMYLAVQANASLRPLTVTPQFWPAMAALGAARAVICGVTKDGELHGFLLVLKNGAEATAAQIGFDRELANAGLPLYLRLLHAGVATAIAAGARQLIFGRTALEPKARLGCKPVETHFWLRHRQPVINSVAKQFFHFIRHDEAPDIDPFKKAG